MNFYESPEFMPSVLPLCYDLNVMEIRLHQGRGGSGGIHPKLM